MKRTNSGRAKIIDIVLNPTYCDISPSYGILRGASQAGVASRTTSKRAKGSEDSQLSLLTTWNLLEPQTQQYLNNTKSYLGLRRVSRVTLFFPPFRATVPLPATLLPAIYEISILVRCDKLDYYQHYHLFR